MPSVNSRRSSMAGSQGVGFSSYLDRNSLVLIFCAVVLATIAFRTYLYSYSSDEVLPAASQHRGSYIPEMQPKEEINVLYFNQSQIMKDVGAAAGLSGPVEKAAVLQRWLWSQEQDAVEQRHMAQVQWIMEHDIKGLDVVQPVSPIVCDLMVNHRYKMLFVRQLKSGSTAIMHAFGVCERREKPTCFESVAHDTPDADIQKWLKEYTVFTFVRNPFVRAASAYSFLNNVVREQLVSNKNYLNEPYCKVGWRDFCKNPRVLARHCRSLPECCGKMNLMTLQRHIDPQYPCMVGDDGNLAVDFIGRAEHSQEDYKKLAELINSKLPEGVQPLDPSKELELANVQSCNPAQHEVLDKVREGQESHIDVDCNPGDKYLTYYLGDANQGCYEAIRRFYQEEVLHLGFTST